MVERNAIDESFERGRTAWPTVALSPEAFRAYVERRGIGDADLLAHAADVFLVTAVFEHEPHAQSLFYSQLKSAVAIAGRIDPGAAFIDEVCQVLGVRLLTGDAPKLATYSATGRLQDWLRVTALRTALNMKRADHLVATEELPLDVILGAAEEAPLLRRYVPDFKRAIEAGFARLTARERTLLRLHFVDGLNIDRLGVMYVVHRATVARWLVAIRAKLLADVKDALAAEHGLDSAAVRSIYRAIASAVQVTLARVLEA